MSETTVVHLLRHGEVHNPDGILYGRLPGYRLSADGTAMAKAAAAALAGRDVIRLVSSPLDRARETAQPVAEEFGLEVVVDDRLIEPTNVFEGLRVGVGDGALRKPQHWRHLRNPVKPSWGEPYAAIVARMLGAIADARAAARGHEAVLVSHQLAIEVTRRSIERRQLWHHPARRRCALASLTSLTYRDDEIVSVDYSEPAGDRLAPAREGRLMLHGERVVLREVRRAELPQVYAWRYDVDNWALASAEPFVPVPFETFERIWTEDREGSDARHASFGLEVEGRLVGTCLLWGIDSFNRLAHVGITIGSREARGQGIGRDALAVLSDYGFRLRGLHRLQVDTLATNEAMLRTARSVGYREEGRLRGAAFVGGSFVDEVVLGLLADEWHGR